MGMRGSVDRGFRSGPGAGVEVLVATEDRRRVSTGPAMGRGGGRVATDDPPSSPGARPGPNPLDFVNVARLLGDP